MSKNENRFSAEYAVSDGYAGGYRPQYFIVSPGDLWRLDESSTDKEFREFFDDSIQEDFSQKISPTSGNFDAFLVWARGVLAQKEEG